MELLVGMAGMVALAAVYVGLGLADGGGGGCGGCDPAGPDPGECGGSCDVAGQGGDVGPGAGEEWRRAPERAAPGRRSPGGPGGIQRNGSRR